MTNHNVLWILSQMITVHPFHLQSMKKSYLEIQLEYSLKLISHHIDTSNNLEHDFWHVKKMHLIAFKSWSSQSSPIQAWSRYKIYKCTLFLRLSIDRFRAHLSKYWWLNHFRYLKSNHFEFEKNFSRKSSSPYPID